LIDPYGLHPGDIFDSKEEALNDMASYRSAIEDYNSDWFSTFIGGYRLALAWQLDDCYWTWDFAEINSGYPPGIGKKPGKLGAFKGRNALRRENRMARDAAKAAGLTREQRQQLHREISGQRMSFEQIVEVANDIAAGK
jgi:hypothetical protein